ncbi:hypothetical protein B0H14DRAFT_2580755 [Mycena olivaceomarginata]|nr:hypothetical protein B0H14DRAFT_2580755 [Mycena olivaceomarginata]
MENTHKPLYAIINLHLKSEQPPAIMDNIAKFVEYIYTFLEAHQDRKKIKHLFRNNEMQNRLKDCHVGLGQATELFGNTAKIMHEELPELIQTISDASSDGSSEAAVALWVEATCCTAISDFGRGTAQRHRGT